jgi:hypothetical protein
MVSVWWAVGFNRPCHPPYEHGLAAVMAGAMCGWNCCGWGPSVGLPANICRLEFLEKKNNIILSEKHTYNKTTWRLGKQTLLSQLFAE